MSTVPLLNFGDIYTPKSITAVHVWLCALAP